VLDKADVELFIKRDDLLDPALGGNKWRKLKYNLLVAQQSNQNTLLTFGGAWSNHIYATAAAGQLLGFNTIGIIRGERPKQFSTTLEYARDCGMQLKFISREQYRSKDSETFLQSLENELGNFYTIPEGGSNVLALKGVKEIIDEINIDFDYITCACGTGATLAGLACGLTSKQKATGFAVLKGGDFLKTDVNHLLSDANIKPEGRWDLETGYHFGGYAKTDKTLFEFIIRFKNEFNIELDAVYTGKMFYGLFDQIKQGAFKPGTTIVALHTGGLQGNTGFPALKM